MFIVPLDATIESIKQVVPQVLVTVQQPAGMPEWVRIMISGVGGGILGFFGSFGMEFIKPRIARNSLKKRIATQLVHELKRNLAVVNKLSPVLVSTAPSHNICAAVLSAHEELRWDRYIYYRDNERGVIYEMDPQGSMNTLLEIPDEMDELSRRYKFGDVYLELRSYTESSNAIINALTNAPTKPMQIDV